MKQLTEEEKAQFVTSPMRKQGVVRTMLMNMKVADIMFIESSEWKWKTAAPSFLCRRVESETTRKFECVKAVQPKTGWIITRTA